MPDGDVVSSSIHHRWRSTLARLRRGATPEEIASHANRALAETLRSSGGIAGQAAYGAIVEARARGELTPAEARVQARLVYRSQEQTPFALVVLRAVARRLALPFDGAAALQPGAITVAEAVCSEVVNAQLLERVRPALVGQCFPDHAAFDRVAEQCHALIARGVAHISASLSKDPSAAQLRAAPTRRRARRPSTAALLNQSIL
jgi:hypothetical protein